MALHGYHRVAIWPSSLGEKARKVLFKATSHLTETQAPAQPTCAQPVRRRGASAPHRARPPLGGRDSRAPPVGRDAPRGAGALTPLDPRLRGDDQPGAASYLTQTQAPAQPTCAQPYRPRGASAPHRARPPHGGRDSRAHPVGRDAPRGAGAFGGPPVVTPKKAEVQAKKPQWNCA